MSIRSYVKTTLLLALVTLGLGGFLLHARIHEPATNPANYVPFISGILSVIVVPLLFAFRGTVDYGYVLNGFLAITGIITMAHFSIVHWPGQATFVTLFTGTLLADIALAAGKFFAGKALFDLEKFGYDANRKKVGASYRYPNYGWWAIHLVLIAVVYALGNLLWR